MYIYVRNLEPYIFPCIYINIYTYTRACVCVYMYIYIHMYMYIFIYIYIRMCICVCIYTYTHVHIHVNICVYIYTNRIKGQKKKSETKGNYQEGIIVMLHKVLFEVASLSSRQSLTQACHLTQKTMIFLDFAPFHGLEQRQNANHPVCTNVCVQ